MPMMPPRTGVPMRKLVLATCLAMTALAALPLAPAGHAARLDSGGDNRNDNALYRATHGAVVALARAGDRIVAVGDRSNILLSDDEGKSWTIAKAEGTALLTAVMFVNPREGYATGQDQTILKTSDGGATWTRQHYEAKTDRNLFALTRAKDGTLYATGAYALALSSTDGSNWKALQVPTFDEDYHLNCVMPAGDDLVITGEAGHTYLIRGGNWVSMPVPYQGSQFGCLTGKDGAIYSFGLRGSLFRGHVPDTIPAAPAAVKAEAGDPQTTAIPELKDVWTRISTGGERPLFGGVVLDDGRLAFGGANGLLLVVDPANGDKLEEVPTNYSGAISALLPTRDGGFVIAGDEGVTRVAAGAGTASGGSAQ